MDNLNYKHEKSKGAVKKKKKMLMRMKKVDDIEVWAYIVVGGVWARNVFMSGFCCFLLLLPK
jgi:CxxC motif-containing protein